MVSHLILYVIKYLQMFISYRYNIYSICATYNLNLYYLYVYCGVRVYLEANECDHLSKGCCADAPQLHDYSLLSEQIMRMVKRRGFARN